MLNEQKNWTSSFLSHNDGHGSGGRYGLETDVHAVRGYPCLAAVTTSAVVVRGRANTSAEAVRHEDGAETGRGAEAAMAEAALPTGRDTGRPFRQNCFSPCHSAEQNKTGPQAELCVAELKDTETAYRNLIEEEIEPATLVSEALGALSVTRQAVMEVVRLWGRIFLEKVVEGYAFSTILLAPSSSKRTPTMSPAASAPWYRRFCSHLTHWSRLDSRKLILSDARLSSS